MEINKQLFEDVLSGKFKGTFVLRNEAVYSSNDLHRNYGTLKLMYPYKIGSVSFTQRGLFLLGGTSACDIIDFKPDKNMKENELTIEIPDNKAVDWEESKKQNKIILKDKQLTYEDVCKKYLKNDFYFIRPNGSIGYLSDARITPNCSKTQHQLECILAKNKLANIALFLNDGWKPLFDSNIFLLRQTSTGVSVFEAMNGSCASDCGSIWFKSEELAKQAIEILGEKTVKLALKPLGI